MKTVRILSIDGGGIRGIVPILYLDYMERILQKYHPSKYLHDYFDVIGGTSTGGLIALGISTPLLKDASSTLPKYNPQSMMDIYATKGDNLFKKAGNKWLSGFQSLVKYKYRAEFIEDLMEELYGAGTLKDTLTQILVTAYDCERMKPHLFRSHPVQSDPTSEDFYIKDAARATSAAPSYFPAAHVYSCPPHSKSYGLVDGGVFANNPSMLTVLEARTMFPDAEKFMVLSLGTGTAKSAYRIEDMQNWGVYQWMSPSKNVPLLNIMMSGQSDTAHYTLDTLAIVDYFRFQVPLDHAHTGMDDVTEDNIKYLQKTTMDKIKQDRIELHKCIDQLLAS